MAKNLVEIRREANLINQNVRSGALLAALDAMQELLGAMITEDLRHSERKELETLAENGIFNIMLDPTIKTVFAMELKYEAGKEQDLQGSIKILIASLNEHEAAKATDALREKEEKLKRDIDEAIEKYNEGDDVKSERVFKKALEDFKVDPFDLVKIGLMYSEHKLFEESIPYFEKAIEMNGREAAWYNYIAISLRKVHRFDEAEQYYLRVSKILGSDPHLFFNLARLYLDCEQWEKAIKAAGASVKIEPEFVEAQKLIKYAQKQAKLAEQKAEEEAKLAAEEAEIEERRKAEDEARAAKKAAEEAEEAEILARRKAEDEARAAKKEENTKEAEKTEETEKAEG